MAKAKALRYNARKERGEIPSKEVLANADPYRWYGETSATSSENSLLRLTNWFMQK